MRRLMLVLILLCLSLPVHANQPSAVQMKWKYLNGVFKLSGTLVSPTDIVSCHVALYGFDAQWQNGQTSQVPLGGPYNINEIRQDAKNIVLSEYPLYYHNQVVAGVYFVNFTFLRWDGGSNSFFGGAILVSPGCQDGAASLGGGLELTFWPGMNPLPGGQMGGPLGLPDESDGCVQWDANLPQGFVNHTPPFGGGDDGGGEDGGGFPFTASDIQGWFVPSEQTRTNMKNTLNSLKSAGPWGMVSDIRNAIESGEAGTEVLVDQSVTMIMPGFSGSYEEVDVPIPGSDQQVGYAPMGGADHGPAVLGLGHGGITYMPLYDYIGIFKQLLRFAFWLCFIMGFVHWLKGRVSV